MVDPEIIDGRWAQFGSPEKWLGPQLVDGGDDGFAYGELNVAGYGGEDSDWDSLTIWIGVIDGVPIEWPIPLNGWTYVVEVLPTYWQEWLNSARERLIKDFIDNYEPPEPHYDDGPWLSEQVERADRIQRELK